MDFLIGFFTPIAPSFTAAITDLAFFVCLLMAMVLCCVIGPGPKRNNYLILFLGLIVGCIAAVLAVPFDPADRALYSPIGSTLGLIVTGYLAGTLGTVAKGVFLPSGNIPDWKMVGYLCFALIGAALSSTVVVVNRTEWIAQAVRCNPGFYAPSLPKEIADRLTADQSTCERLNIGGQAKPLQLGVPIDRILRTVPYSLAYMRDLSLQKIESSRCMFTLKPGSDEAHTPGLFLECKIIKPISSASAPIKQ